MRQLIKRFLRSRGYEIQRIHRPPPRRTEPLDGLTLRKINYACGARPKEGWLNVDGYVKTSDDVILMDLTYRHPFEDDFFEWGFSEDFVEHLQQADSLIFLAEIYRTFKPGGVCRLTFPSMDGQLAHGERFFDYESAHAIRVKYYDKHKHIHLYDRHEFEAICRFIGFSDVAFKQFHESDHPELRNLEWRDYVRHYNLYVELTK